MNHSRHSQLSTFSSQLIPPGYKQTEVGVIPEDWDVKRLGELASIAAGGTPSRAIARYWNGDIPWITTSEVSFHTIMHSEQFITKEGLKNSAAKLLPPGTLLIALYGQGKTRGKVAVLGIEAATNQACAAISLRRGVSSNFVLHFLGSQYEAIRNLSNTGNQENLNGTLVRSILLLLPPMGEQEAIAEALSDADALIESLEQLLAKKRQLKQGVMQELLTGKKRLPGFSGEWEVKPLRDVCIKIQDGTHFSPTIRGGKYLYVTSKNIGHGAFDVKDAPRIDEDQHRAIYRRCDPKRGDLLLTKDGASTGNAALNTLDEEFSLLSSVALLRFDPEVYDASYFLQQILSYAGQAHIKDQMSGNAITRLTLAKINRLRFPVCEILEQRAIAAILSDMDTEIAALEANLAKARQLKQGMMQELLTGKTRLVDSGKLIVKNEGKELGAESGE